MVATTSNGEDLWACLCCCRTQSVESVMRRAALRDGGAAPTYASRLGAAPSPAGSFAGTERAPKVKAPVGAAGRRLSAKRCASDPDGKDGAASPAMATPRPVRLPMGSNTGEDHSACLVLGRESGTGTICSICSLATDGSLARRTGAVVRNVRCDVGFSIT